ncbi:hypothetical protein ACP4OV_031374 [Aristida adscensionis]
MSAQTKQRCPLCVEEMDLTDKQLKPCKCGYEICLWCWHQLMEMDQKCPGCRCVYNKDRIMGTSVSNQMHVLFSHFLKELCADKSTLQKEQSKSHKQKHAKGQLGLPEEPKDPNNVRVIQRKLVYIVGMPSELATEKVLRQKNFLGQYGKIENIIIDNVGANQLIPDSGRVYVTFSREDEAIRCIQAVNGYILDGIPLKATFGVTRYCHIWLDNRVCRKPNCSYVHYKASEKDICTKDDVSVVCARLQHLMGIDTKGFQHRSGNTLPPPADCNSRTSVCNGISKDICTNGDRLLPNGANKSPVLLPATPQDSSLSSGCPSIANAVLHRQSDHESIHNNPQNMPDLKSQKFADGTLLQSSLNVQLASNNDKSRTSTELGDDSSNSKQITPAENGSSDSSLQKPQYVSVVSQGQGGSGRRFTVLTRQMASTDTRSKATGQVGTSDSTKLTLAKGKPSDSITIPRSQNMGLVYKGIEQPLHRLASASVKAQTGAEKKNECSGVTEKLLPGSHKQLSESTVSQSSSVVQSKSNNPNLINLFTPDAQSQAPAGLQNMSDVSRKLASKNQLELVKWQNAAASNTGIARGSRYHIICNQVPLADGKCHTSAGGDLRLYNGQTTQSGDRVSPQGSDSTLVSRPKSVISSTGIVAADRNGRKRQACPPGFEKLNRSSDSDKFVTVGSSTCSQPCSTSVLVQDALHTTDQPDVIGWVSQCLEDDGNGTGSTNNVSISSPLSSTHTIWGGTQFPGSFFSGSSGHPHLSSNPSGLLQCMVGVENAMSGCTLASVSCTAYEKPGCSDGSTGSHMSTGGYDAFRQGKTSGMRAGMGGTLIQQPPLPNPHYGMGNIDSYPSYSLF